MPALQQRTRIDPLRAAAARLGALPLLLLAACGQRVAEAADASPDVLWIVVDTLRASELGAYGAELSVTPELDRLAAGSAVFERCFANAPWTKPSVATMFTSLHGSQHFVFQESSSNRLAESFETVAEVFQDAGYRTAAFSQNPHVHAATGFSQGFETFQTGALWQTSPDELRAVASDWLAAGAEDPRPSFLYVQFLDPHDPYRPDGSPLAEPEPEGEVDSAVLVREGAAGLLVEHGELVADLTVEEGAALHALYRAELGRVDRAVGELLEAARRASEREPVILFTSDHGEEFLEHGGLLHGYRLYDEALHVPLLVSAPGLEARRIEELVSHVDLAPTVLELAGLWTPESYAGRSLVPGLRGEPLARRPVVSETGWNGVNRVSVRTREWKRIEDRKAGTVELYDLTRDPGEHVDVADERRDVAQKLAGLAAAVLVPLPEFDPVEAFGPPDAHTEARLRDLGYTDG